MMKDKKYIIFDLDGTLVDSFPTIVNVCKRVFKEYAPAAIPSDELFENYRGRDIEQMFMDLSERLNVNTNEFRKKYDAQYALDCLTGTIVIRQQKIVLKEAKAMGLGIIVLTNKRQELAEKVCSALFSNGEIDYIIGRKGTEPIKPRQVIIERLKKCGINAERQCLKYFGDSEIDRITAKLLKVEYININYNHV